MLITHTRAHHMLGFGHLTKFYGYHKIDEFAKIEIDHELMSIRNVCVWAHKNGNFFQPFSFDQ